MKWIDGIAVIVCGLLCAPALAGNGFTLLGFRSEAEVTGGSYRNWEALGCGIGPQYAPGEPVVLTYKISDDFLANQSPTTAANARAAIEAALATWTDGTHGFVRFVESQWEPVQNHDSNPIACIEGPGIDEWLALPNPQDIPPGWGGNIEFFSVGTGFRITSNGVNYEMGPGNLAFAVIYWIGNKIESADLYVNHDFTWTTSSAAAALAPGFEPQPYLCACGHSHDGSQTLPPDGPRPGGEPVGASYAPQYDVQTVITHEIGHVLGLDHPNEAGAMGGALIESVLFSYLPPNCWDNGAVMHSSYTGVKRALEWSEFGAMAFLYPPGTIGDIDSDGQVSLLDALRGIELASPEADPTPWEIVLLDFLERDGVISVEEISQIMLWATRPTEFPPPETPAMPGLCDGSPNAVTITAAMSPWDIGVGQPARVDVFIDNSSALPVQAWDFEMQYDTAILSNPQLINGTILPGGIWIDLGPDDGAIKFSKLSVGEDCSVSGLLGSIQFDVNITAAVAMGTTSVVFPMQDLIVTCPSLHEYGTLINENLTVLPASAIAWNYDADNNGIISMDDWYAFNLNPIDVDGDGSVTEMDRRAFRDNLRFGEIPSMNVNR